LSLKEVADKKCSRSPKRGLFGFAGFFGACCTAVLNFRIKRGEGFFAYLTFLFQQLDLLAFLLGLLCVKVFLKKHRPIQYPLFE
jgi:hypothetical protein